MRDATPETADRGNLLQQILDTASIAIFLVDKRGRITHANRRMAEMFGRPLPELIGCEYVDLVHPSERESGRRKMLALLAGEIAAVDLDRLYWRKDGSAFWGQLSGRRFHDARGVDLGLIGLIADVTERKRAEEKLRHNERLLQTIIDAEPECVKLLDADANLIMMNRAGLEMIEADSLEQVQGRCVCPMIGPAFRHPFMDLVRLVFRGGSGTATFEIVGLKGGRRWLETHAVPLRNEKDEITALLGVTRDVTERKRAAEALQASEARFRAIIESASVGILVASVETRRIRYANPAISRMLGYDEREFLLLSVPDLIAPEEVAQSAAAFAAHANGTANATERTFRRRDGVPVRVAIQTVRMEFEGETCLLGFIVDTTARHLLEEERLKAQKLESVGTLAGGIAHDFNNLLQGVFGYISMARLAADQREQSLAMLGKAEQALGQAVSLTNQLLTFSKGGTPVKKALALPPLIENACALSLSGSRTACRIAVEPGLWAVEADEGQLAQVIQNIVLNADQAMPLGGAVEIAARNLPGDATARPVGAPPGDAVEIVIRDSGVGIPEEHLPRIFDPYFTTKERGSGLGLATSHSIIRNHGGTLSASSVLGKGSTFTILLPASRRQPETPAPVPAPSLARRGRILFMDDEDLVRTVAVEILRSLGHAVDAVDRGEAAVERFREARAAGRPYDVVILDVTIRNGMGGMETVRALREIDPAVRAVVSSGYADGDVISNYRRHGFAACLRKPYTVARLGRILDECWPER